MPRHAILRHVILIVIALLTACRAQPAEDTLPLLPPGFSLGTTFYGSAALPEPGTSERTLLDEAVTSGLRGFTYYVDWADLEPEPGRYTLGEFTAQLDDLQALGVQPFVNLTIGDSGGYNLPLGLGDDAGGLAPEVALDDPAVTERFGQLLEQLVPVLVERGGFYLGLGNEMGEYLASNRRERAAYARFVEVAREKIETLEPRLTVGVTLTPGSVRNETHTFRDLRDVTDLIAFNYSPIQADFTVLPLEAIREDFQAVLRGYGEGPILIQELTCPSAATMGSSEAWQAGCYARLFEEIAARPQVRFASVFTFQDFDAATCDVIRDAIFGDELTDLPEEIATRLTDYLCQLGVVAPDGRPKQTWANVLEVARGPQLSP